jgi:hypothetical protein
MIFAKRANGAAPNPVCQRHQYREAVRIAIAPLAGAIFHSLLQCKMKWYPPLRALPLLNGGKCWSPTRFVGLAVTAGTRL